MEIKVQCPCGTRFAFEVEPINGQMPFAINCPGCNADSTPAANEVIQRNLAPVTAPSPVAPPNEKPKLSLKRAHEESHASAPPAASSASSSGEVADGSKCCPKHPRELATDVCFVCGKPICLKCMEIFGYLCSVTCRNKSLDERIKVPVCKGQKSVQEGRLRRKAALVAISIVLFVAAAVGVYGWYYLVGSRPAVFYSLRLGEGEEAVTRFVGSGDVLVLDQGKLSLHDLKQGRVRWSASVTSPPAPGADKGAGKRFRRVSSAGAQIHVNGGDIWVCLPDKLLRYDLQSGQSKGVTPIPGRVVSFSPGANHLLIVAAASAEQRVLMRVGLPSGSVDKEELKLPKAAKESVMLDDLMFGAQPTASLLLERELNEDKENYRIDKLRSELIGTGQNFTEFRVKLEQANLVRVQAMKADTGKTVLNEKTSVTTSSREMFEELANEMQRNKTGGMKTVDESRYSVTLRRRLTQGAAEWTGNVTGKPLFYPLATVDVLVAGKSMVVFDKKNKKLFQHQLTYPIAEDFVEASRSAAPCLEANGDLLFFDQGVLTSFELPSGRVRWRLTSVWISKVQVDSHGALYVSTTTGSPENIQYSEQITLNDRVSPLVLKVDAKSGKILWKNDKIGQDCHLSGRFLYTTDAQTSTLELAKVMNGGKGPTGPTHFRIRRLKEGTGEEVWEWYYKGEPELVDFHDNHILIRTGNELRVMKFLAL